jgi:hypothetical protein|tara:strand:- start:36 stop:950 length:915 start_codon:yes stop_codon:yes gene_type:complete
VIEPRPSAGFRAERLSLHPIIHGDLAGLEGERGANINGPSLVRVPAWVESPLGRYYLYFAHHGGHYVRMAHADSLTGPWTVLPEPGVLHMDAGPGSKHIASPDVLIDEDTRQLRMYFHQPVEGQGQRSFLALSSDGLHWQVQPQVLGMFYFRVFRRPQDDTWYAFSRDTNVGGMFCRSANGLRPFEDGPAILPGCRHAATWVEDQTLHLFYSVAGDTPERILVSQVDLTKDWVEWQPSPGQVVLEPELDWEGGHLPLEPSRWGRVQEPARQLRDPGIYAEDDELYLLYSGAGEQNIGIARLHRT